MSNLSCSRWSTVERTNIKRALTLLLVFCSALSVSGCCNTMPAGHSEGARNDSGVRIVAGDIRSAVKAHGLSMLYVSGTLHSAAPVGEGEYAAYLLSSRSGILAAIELICAEARSNNAKVDERLLYYCMSILSFYQAKTAEEVSPLAKLVYETVPYATDYAEGSRSRYEFFWERYIANAQRFHDIATGKVVPQDRKPPPMPDSE